MGFIRDEDREARYALHDTSKMKRISVDEYFALLHEQAGQLAQKLIDRWRECYVEGGYFDRNVYVSFLPATIIVDSRNEAIRGEPCKEAGRAILKQAIDRILPDAEPYKVFIEPTLLVNTDEDYVGPDRSITIEETGHVRVRLYVYP